MRIGLIGIVWLVLAAVASAQTVIVIDTPGTYILQGGKLIGPVPVLRPGDSPIPPQPPDPKPPIPTPDKTLAEAATSAFAAINYADKDTHSKQLAFTLNFMLSQVTGSNSPPGEIVAKVKGLADSVIGKDATQWAPFWAAVEPYLRNCTTTKALVEAYGTVLDVISGGVQADPAFANETFCGVATYGLQADGKWLEFIMKILPIILEIIKMFL